ncbi:MAG: C25 family cysteine peptidase [Candidatus Thorarchaeota archaeon]
MRSGESNTILTATAICIIILLVAQAFVFVDVIGRDLDTQQADSTKWTSSEYVSSFDVTPVPVAGGPDWYSYDTSIDPGKAADVHVTLSDTSGIRVVANFFGYWDEDIILNLTAEYDRPYIPGTKYMQIEGKPELPRITKFIEVPNDVNISVNVLRTSSAVIPGYDIAPFQPQVLPFWNDTEFGNVPDLVDNIGDDKDIFPSYNVTIEGNIESNPNVIRGRRICKVSFYPMHYNASSDDLIVYSMMEISLDYNRPAQIEPPHPSWRSTVFEKIFQNFLLNYKDWNTSGVIYDPSTSFTTAGLPYSTLPTGAEYLIIVEDDFLPAAEKLAAWKTTKGVPTKVVTSTQIGSAGLRATAAEITAFLRNEVFVDSGGWDPKPSYVLLFGDSEYIPTNYLNPHPALLSEYEPWEALIASDLYYFTDNANDFIPNTTYGRISVDSIDEAIIVVDKILKYEIDPPGASYEEFYNSILASTFFQDWKPADGTEDFRTGFAKYCEEARSYLARTGYNVHFNASTNATTTPTLFMDYKPIPDYPSLYPNFNWIAHDDIDGSKSNITANFEAGRFFIFHVDHGSSRNFHQTFEGWGAPRFTTDFVQDLDNGDLLPLVFSSDCSVGWFDGEIDQEYMQDGNGYSWLTDDYESLSEILLRKSGGGALATIGATREAWIHTSFDVLNGTIHAFWPDPSTPNIQPVYEIGAAFYEGLLFVDQDNDDYYTRPTVESYHLFGDPETSLWTEFPTEFVVTHASQLGTQGTQHFVVRVNDTNGNPVPDAKVCLQKGAEVYQVQMTGEDGCYIFDIPSITGGEMNVTVTKHNFIPYNVSIEVVDSAATLSVTPVVGPEGQSLDFTINGFDTESEVKIYISNVLITTIIAGDTEGSGLLTGGVLGPINIKANQTGHVALALFNRLSGSVETDPYTYSQRDDTTWYLSGGVKTYNNPCIRIYEIEPDPSIPTATITTPVPSHQLVVNKDYLVEIQVWNQEFDEAGQTKVNLSFAVLGSGLGWIPIGQDIITVPARDITNPDIHGMEYAYVPWTPTYEGHVCLSAFIEQDYDINLVNNRGNENTRVLPVESPTPRYNIGNILAQETSGSASVVIGNPTNSSTYPYTELRQIGSYSDVWNARISGYISEILTQDDNVTLSFTISLPESVNFDDWRIFMVEEFISGMLVGGFEINVTKVALTTTMSTPTTSTSWSQTSTPTTPTTTIIDPTILAILLATGAAVGVIILIVYVKRLK